MFTYFQAKIQPTTFRNDYLDFEIECVYSGEKFFTTRQITFKELSCEGVIDILFRTAKKQLGDAIERRAAELGEEKPAGYLGDINGAGCDPDVR
jgi:hypothetical protein